MWIVRATSVKDPKGSTADADVLLEVVLGEVVDGSREDKERKERERKRARWLQRTTGGGAKAQRKVVTTLRQGTGGLLRQEGRSSEGSPQSASSPPEAKQRESALH